jgi:peroxiredoxin
MTGNLGRGRDIAIKEFERMKRNVLLTALIAGTLAFSGGALAQNNKDTKEQPKKETTGKDHKDHKHDAGKATVGEKAPDFTLTDTEGKNWTLSELTKQKKIVVLEWFNADCPYSGVKHYKDHQTMQNTAKAYKDKNVVWISVASNDNKTGSKERNDQARKDWKIEHPIVLDTTGDVARAYNAKNTPTMAVINADGTLAYWGAIDNDTSAENVGKVNYVAKALDEIIAGQTVTESTTKPYGCSVKAKAPAGKGEKTEKPAKEEKK